MERNHDAMAYLASLLNRHCPRQCKVLLTGMDLLCFNLSVLAEYAHQIYLYNIVGVTGHLGMETLPTISRVSVRANLTFILSTVPRQYTLAGRNGTLFYPALPYVKPNTLKN